MARLSSIPTMSFKLIASNSSCPSSIWRLSCSHLSYLRTKPNLWSISSILGSSTLWSSSNQATAMHHSSRTSKTSSTSTHLRSTTSTRRQASISSMTMAASWLSSNLRKIRISWSCTRGRWWRLLVGRVWSSAFRSSGRSCWRSSLVLKMWLRHSITRRSRMRRPMSSKSNYWATKDSRSTSTSILKKRKSSWMTFRRLTLHKKTGSCSNISGFCHRTCCHLRWLLSLRIKSKCVLLEQAAFLMAAFPAVWPETKLLQAK